MLYLKKEKNCTSLSSERSLIKRQNRYWVLLLYPLLLFVFLIWLMESKEKSFFFISFKDKLVFIGIPEGFSCCFVALASSWQKCIYQLNNSLNSRSAACRIDAFTQKKTQKIYVYKMLWRLCRHKMCVMLYCTDLTESVKIKIIIFSCCLFWRINI